MKMFMIIRDELDSGKFFTATFVNGYGYPENNIYFDEDLAKKQFDYYKSKGYKVKMVAFDCAILAEN